jgi:hypothetical protein
MAALTPTGITFSDGTSLNSKYGIVPQNAVSVFFMSGAPTNWVRLAPDSDHNDKTLRVVNGTGGGFGGTSAFTTVFPNSLRPVAVPSVPISGTVSPHTLSVPELPSHAHGNGGSVGLSPGGGDVGAAAGWSRNFPGTANNGGGLAHSHGWSGTASFSTNIDLRVQYIDVILCRFA